MKKTLLFACVLCLAAATAPAQKLKGSDTVLPLSQKEAEAYLRKNPASGISVTGGGSGVGIASLIDGSTDIAMSSRKMKFAEKAKLKQADRTPVETVIAYDALAVIVHPANPVSQLTREQLEGIFTGKIDNWKQVGGPDLKIVAYARESSSGTYEFFKEHILDNKNYAPSVLSMPATGAVVQSVGQTRGAIGYIGLAYLSGNVKALKVSYDGGTGYVAPSFATARNKTYPVVRPLLYYHLKENEKKAAPFIRYVLSPEGQQVVKNVGYIPVK